MNDSNWDSVENQISLEWNNCSEGSVQLWCSDSFGYYQFDLYGEAERNESGGTVRFFGIDAPNQINEFVLNLRKDGLVLARVEFGSESFDVVEELGVNPTQEQMQKTDRELIEFMHKHQQQSTRILYWKRQQDFFEPEPQKKVKLESDGDLIVLSVSIKN